MTSKVIELLLLEETFKSLLSISTHELVLAFRYRKQPNKPYSTVAQIAPLQLRAIRVWEAKEYSVTLGPFKPGSSKFDDIP
jgi:hypothetical protein